MEKYYEQSVARPGSAKTGLAYGLCWMLIVALMIIALLFASSALPESAGNALEVNWLSVLGLALCLVLAGILYVRKDYLRMEFDYILHDGVLEISGVMNRRRRKKLARIDLNRVLQAGAVPEGGSAALGPDKSIRRHKWYACECRHYLLYKEESIRHAALLELDAQLCELVRRQLPVGAWRNEKEESTKHASLS